MFEDDDFKKGIIQQIGNDPNGNLVFIREFNANPILQIMFDCLLFMAIYGIKKEAVVILWGDMESIISVMDNLNIHTVSSFYKRLSPIEASN